MNYYPGHSSETIGHTSAYACRPAQSAYEWCPFAGTATPVQTVQPGPMTPKNFPAPSCPAGAMSPCTQATQDQQELLQEQAISTVVPRGLEPEFDAASVGSASSFDTGAAQCAAVGLIISPNISSQGPYPVFPMANSGDMFRGMVGNMQQMAPMMGNMQQMAPMMGNMQQMAPMMCPVMLGPAQSAVGAMRSNRVGSGFNSVGDDTSNCFDVEDLTDAATQALSTLKT